MEETMASSNPVLRHGRDPDEPSAGPSGRGTSLFSTQLSLSAAAPAYSHCPCSHSQSIPKLLLIFCLISLCLLGLQFLVRLFPMPHPGRLQHTLGFA